jgi:hypothetical protein
MFSEKTIAAAQKHFQEFDPITIAYDYGAVTIYPVCHFAQAAKTIMAVSYIDQLMFFRDDAPTDKISARHQQAINENLTITTAAEIIDDTTAIAWMDAAMVDFAEWRLNLEADPIAALGELTKKD